MLIGIGGRTKCSATGLRVTKPHAGACMAAGRSCGSCAPAMPCPEATQTCGSPGSGAPTKAQQLPIDAGRVSNLQHNSDDNGSSLSRSGHRKSNFTRSVPLVDNRLVPKMPSPRGTRLSADLAQMSSLKQLAARLAQQVLGGMSAAQQADCVRGMGKTPEWVVFLHNGPMVREQLEALRTLEQEHPRLCARRVVARWPRILLLDMQKVRESLDTIAEALSPCAAQVEDAAGVAVTLLPRVVANPWRVEKFLDVLAAVVSRRVAAAVLARHPEIMGLSARLALHNFRAWQAVMGLPRESMEEKVALNPALFKFSMSRSHVVAVADATGMSVTRVRRPALLLLVMPHSVLLVVESHRSIHMLYTTQYGVDVHQQPA